LRHVVERLLRPCHPRSRPRPQVSRLSSTSRPTLPAINVFDHRRRMFWMLITNRSVNKQKPKYKTSNFNFVFTDAISSVDQGHHSAPKSTSRPGA